MIQVVQLMALKKIRPVTLAEIEDAAAIWSKLGHSRRLKKVPTSAARSFTRVAKGWFAFLGNLESPAPSWFESTLQIFIGRLSTENLLPKTIDGYAWQIGCFFKFLPDGYDVERITPSDVDAFITAKIRLGWKLNFLSSICQRLRRFFRFAETQGWCEEGLHLSIRRIRRKTRQLESKAPNWNEVLRLIKSFKGRTALECRSKAMLMLCAIYGLRSVEVIRLELGDIDWRNATFVVRRAKGGGVQQYPLLYEVGEAILRYLEYDRPPGGSRRLFLSLRPPFRETSQSSLWQAIGPLMRDIGSRTDYVGAHSLRHACATRLLQKGASLKHIADFLGHRHVRSADVYAKLDIRRLRRVAAFGISDLL
jgi:integrase/recombinase XerD